jgi:hypothetical protein
MILGSAIFRDDSSSFMNQESHQISIQIVLQYVESIVDLITPENPNIRYTKNPINTKNLFRIEWFLHLLVRLIFVEKTLKYP